MKIICNPKELSATLSMLAQNLSKKAVLISDSYYLFESSGQALKISSVNNGLRTKISSEIPCKGDSFEIYVPGDIHKIINIIKHLDTVTIDIDDMTLKIIIKSKTGCFTIYGKRPNEEREDIFGFPDTFGPDMSLEKKLLPYIFQATQYVTDDQFQPAMTGVHLFFKNGTLIVEATNGYHMIAINFEDIECKTLEVDFIIPTYLASILKNIKENINLYFLKNDENRIIALRIISENCEIISYTIDERYPPAQELRDRYSHADIVFNSFDAGQASHELMRLTKVGDERGLELIFAMNPGNLLLKTPPSEHDLVEGAIEVPFDPGETGFEPIVMKINKGYLLQALSIMKDTVSFHYSYPEIGESDIKVRPNPFIITKKEDKITTLLLIMPITMHRDDYERYLKN